MNTTTFSATELVNKIIKKVDDEETIGSLFPRQRNCKKVMSQASLSVLKKVYINRSIPVFVSAT